MSSLFKSMVVVLLFASCGGTTQIFMVGPRMVGCTGVGPQDCLQIKRDGKDSWENFYGSIDGFDYEPGYDYILEVKVSKVDNPPADASSLKYTLKKVVKKEKASITEETLNGNYNIQTLLGEDVSNAGMTINFNAKEGQVYGKGVCNRYSGTYVTRKGEIKFSPAATTRMMCGEPHLEQTFFQKMNQVDGFNVHDKLLTLIIAGKTLLTAIPKTEQ